MLFRTTEDHGHWHLLYVGQIATTSEGNDGHRHVVQAMPDQPPAILPWADPETGEEHGHAVSPDPVGEGANKPKSHSSAKEKAKTMVEVLELFKIADAADKESLEEAETAKRYAKADQWLDEDREELEAQGRPALTMPLIPAMMDLLSGNARQNRMDFRWFPVEGSDSGMADLYNFVSKHLAKRTNLESEDNDVGEQQRLTGRSFYEVIPEFTRNPIGEVAIRHFPSENVRALPHRKKDMSDCEGIFKVQDISLADAKTRYPEMKDKFDALFVNELPKISDPVTTELIESPDRYGATVATDFVDQVLSRDTVVDIGKKTIRILEFERREYRAAHFLVVPSESLVVEVTAEEKAKAETLEPLVKTLDTQQAVIREILSVGPYIIKDSYPIRPFKDEFSLVAVYAKKDGNEFWGKVRDVKDAQDEVNKRHSQIMDILNKMAAYGYLYDDDTFGGNKEDQQRFDRDAATPGFRCRIANTEKPPLKMEGAKFPAEIFQMEQASIQMFNLISNVNTQMMGQAKAQESGFSKQIQIRQAMIGNEFLFDNFMLAKRRVGRLAMGWAKLIYTPERIARIVIAGAGSANQEGLKIGANQMQPEMPDQEKEYWLKEIARMWEISDLMDYDVEVGEGQLSPTAKQAAFSQFLEAAKTGVPIPPELLMEMSDLPEHAKRRYGAMMKEMQEQKLQIEQGKVAAEIQKARGGAPDAALPSRQPPAPAAPGPQVPPAMPPGMG